MYFDTDNPSEDPNISGDPYKTLFVARLVSNVVLCILDFPTCGQYFFFGNDLFCSPLAEL
jgi:hypothetical protein